MIFEKFHTEDLVSFDALPTMPQNAYFSKFH